MRVIWTEEEDVMLAEAILRHIREGSSQMNAFEEVGMKLNRSAAACGFRWNAYVRHHYVNALELAKKHRKQLKNTQQECEIHSLDDLSQLEQLLKQAIEDINSIKQGKLTQKNAKEILLDIKDALKNDKK